MGVTVREKIKDSGEWWVFIAHQGRRTSRKVGGEAAAKDAASKIQARLTLGKGALPEKAKLPTPTLEQYFKRFEANYKSTLKPSTWYSYEISLRIHILPEFGKYPLDEITKPMMKKLVAEWVKKGFAKDSIRLYLASFKVLYNQAIDDKVVSENPTKGLGLFYRQAKRKHEEISPLTEGESLLLLQKTLEYERTHYPLFLCALHTGMRSGELRGLQWEDIDWNGMFLEVRRAIDRFDTVATVKTENGLRRIDLSDHLLETLRDLRKQRQQEALKNGKNEIPAWVFPNRSGSFVNINNVKARNFKRVLKKAELRSIRFHDLRHTFASQLLSKGTNILYVSQQLGHANPGVTMKIYAKWIPNEGQRQAMNNLPYVGRLSDVSDNSQEEKVAI